jgi:hypothetical protein
MDKMDLVEEGHEGEVLTLDEDGNPVASSYTIGTDTLTGDENTLATEAGVTNYMGETYISKESLKTTDTIDTENPSGDTAMSEQGVVESLSWKDQA